MKVLDEVLAFLLSPAGIVSIALGVLGILASIFTQEIRLWLTGQAGQTTVEQAALKIAAQEKRITELENKLAHSGTALSASQKDEVRRQLIAAKSEKAKAEEEFRRSKNSAVAGRAQVQKHLGPQGQAVLELFSKHPAGLTSLEIAALYNCKVSTAKSIIAHLVMAKLIARQKDGKYELVQ